MMKLMRVIVFLFFPAMIISCGRESYEKKMARMKSVPVNLNLTRMQCWDADTLVVNRPWESRGLKLCVFVSDRLCTSCYLKKMFQWEDFLRYEEENDFFIYFIFEPQEGCEENFWKFFYQAELDHPFYLDKNKEFLKSNPNVPSEYMFHTFLLDEKNNVILVGDILHDQHIEDQFKRIIAKRKAGL